MTLAGCNLTNRPTSAKVASPLLRSSENNPGRQVQCERMLKFHLPVDAINQVPQNSFIRTTVEFLPTRKSPSHSNGMLFEWLLIWQSFLELADDPEVIDIIS